MRILPYCITFCILAIMSIGITNAQPLTVTAQYLGRSKEWGMHVCDIKVTVKNNTADTIKYITMSCSWDDMFQADTSLFEVQGVFNCDRNVVECGYIMPFDTMSRLLIISPRYHRIVRQADVKVGFNYLPYNGPESLFDNQLHEVWRDKKNIFWSNPITYRDSGRKSVWYKEGMFTVTAELASYKTPPHTLWGKLRTAKIIVRNNESFDIKYCTWTCEPIFFPVSTTDSNILAYTTFACDRNIPTDVTVKAHDSTSVTVFLCPPKPGMTIPEGTRFKLGIGYQCPDNYINSHDAYMYDEDTKWYWSNEIVYRN